MSEIDLTENSTGWGHGFSIIDWPKGDLWVWLTPGPSVGDSLTLSGKKGDIRAEVINVERNYMVDDMYRISIKPVG